jgi:hypothetical protein
VQGFDVVHMEYDDDRSGGFEPLRDLPDDITVALAPQCGFASAAETAADRKVTSETQADKLRLVSQTARSVWG